MGSGFPRRLKVQVEHEIGSGIEAQGESVGLDGRERAGLPEQKVAVGVERFCFDG